MTNLSILSTEATDFLKTKVGYRNDSIYGSGETNIKDVLLFEIAELGNTDVLETCQKLYPQITCITDELIESIENYELDEDDIEDFLDDFLSELSYVFPEMDQVIWVCHSLEDVLKNYTSNDTDAPSDSFIRVPFDTPVILSDLGSEGFLVLTCEINKESIVLR